MTFLKVVVPTLSAVSLSASFAFARDNVHVAGSSTVLPYAAIVAEAFGENFDFPKIGRAHVRTPVTS